MKRAIEKRYFKSFEIRTSEAGEDDNVQEKENALKMTKVIEKSMKFWLQYKTYKNSVSTVSHSGANFNDREKIKWKKKRILVQDDTRNARKK